MAIGASDLEPARDVGACLRRVEQSKCAPEGHALFELHERWNPQQIGELRLTRQNKRQQLPSRRFDVRQKSYLFEKLTGEALRLVNNQRGSAALVSSGQQLAFELCQQRRLRPQGPWRQIERPREKLDELLARQRRVDQMDDARASTRFGLKRCL